MAHVIYTGMHDQPCFGSCSMSLADFNRLTPGKGSLLAQCMLVDKSGCCVGPALGLLSMGVAWV